MMIIANFADYFMPASATAKESGAEPDASSPSEQDFAFLLAASFAPVPIPPVTPGQSPPSTPDPSLSRAESATAKAADLSLAASALPPATALGIEIPQGGMNFLPTSGQLLSAQTTHSLAVGRESQIIARPSFSLAFLTQPNAESPATTTGLPTIPSSEPTILAEKIALPASPNPETVIPAKTTKVEAESVAQVTERPLIKPLPIEASDQLTGTSVQGNDKGSSSSVTSLPSTTILRVPSDVPIQFEMDSHLESATPKQAENLVSSELSPLGLTAETVKIAASVVKSLVNAQKPETEALSLTNQEPEVDTIPATKALDSAQVVWTAEFAEPEPIQTVMKVSLADSLPAPSLSSLQATSKSVAGNENADAPTVGTIDSAEPKQATEANPSIIPPLATALAEPTPPTPQTTIRTEAGSDNTPVQSNTLPDNASVQRAEPAVTEQQKIAALDPQVQQETLRNPIVTTEVRLATMPKDQEVRFASTASIRSNETNALAETHPAPQQDATVAPAKVTSESLPDKYVEGPSASTKNASADLTISDSKSPLPPTVNLRPSHETRSESIAEAPTTATSVESSNEPILMAEESTETNSITPITANRLAHAPTASSNYQPNEAQPIATQTIHPIIELAQTTPHRETRSLRISLNPEELGKIEVEVTRDAEGRLSAAFSAERVEAASSLTHSLGHLREMLEQAGLRVEHLEVTVTPQFQNSTSGQPGHQQQSQAQSSAPADFLPLSQTSENNPDSTEEEKLLNLRA